MNIQKRLKNIYDSILEGPPFSQLFFVSDQSNWVLSWEISETMDIARQLGIKTKETLSFGFIQQSVFYASKYMLLNPKTYLLLSSVNSKIAFSYFHGYPNSGNPIFSACFNNFKKYHRHISRIQVSHSKMKNYVLETGIAPHKVFLIPIAVNPSFFNVQTKESKKIARDRLGIPQQAVVIGSFQKDGVGKNEGIEPKLIKGPDTFITTLKLLQQKIPEIFILLSGPARGYIKKHLEILNIPYKHIYLNNYPDICYLYDCLDLYIVSSREEGGPKAILESMISGVPLVTTCVGQAMDLVDHEINAMMAPVENAEQLADYAQKVLEDSELAGKLINNGFITARQNTYSAHLAKWDQFFDGFVKKSENFGHIHHYSNQL